MNNDATRGIDGQEFPYTKRKFKYGEKQRFTKTDSEVYKEASRAIRLAIEKHGFCSPEVKLYGWWWKRFFPKYRRERFLLQELVKETYIRDAETLRSLVLKTYLGLNEEL